LHAFFEHHDFIVWPTNCQPAYDAEADIAGLELDETPILATPALGLPALSIPFGSTPDGLPVSLQLIGRRYFDVDLLAVARFLEHGG
jgi:Asp-tRNA(Asn)/Glu-tRNA(Gln) amidotransferase A subunit family amidase